MKTRFTLLAFLLLCITGLNAQTGFFGGQGVPLKPQSPLFGYDVLINDQLSQNQRMLDVCSAFNGWLYAIYSHSESDGPWVAILKSINNGKTWSIIWDENSGSFGDSFTRLNLISTGNDTSNLYLFMSGCLFHQSSLIQNGFVSRFNCSSGLFEDGILNDDSHKMRDISISSDIIYPAVGSIPYSIAVVYSKAKDFGVGDTVIFASSSNGGMSFNFRIGVASSLKYFNRVSLAYGRSPSWSSGRYFAAWEEKLTSASTIGHIYTSHSEPNFNSSFTKPICLDSLDPSAINRARNPIISCQVNNSDNDSANLTEVVLFEKYKPSGGDYDVTGFYNLQATTTSHFRPLNIAATSNNELQPDISFNPYNSKFMVTYFDSTVKKLPFMTNDISLANPNSWNVVSQGYNDNSNLVAPYPKVEVNFGNQDGMNAWISEGTGGNGIALFDAPYSTYTGVSENNIGTSAKLIGSYPNPCSNTIKIVFELKNAGRVTINVTGIMGQALGTVTDQNYPAGRHVVQYNVSGIPGGNYIYKFRSGDFTTTGKFTVIR
jgi:hypothetical protein